jgi:hypothetical protein
MQGRPVSKQSKIQGMSEKRFWPITGVQGVTWLKLEVYNLVKTRICLTFAAEIIG